jgi:6-pyruvoyltetrahydropterin/6-carboxytetrahydropterin synthase
LFTVSIQTSFWASHQISLGDGRKEPIHSHNWIVTAEVGSGELNKLGLAIDFNRLKKIIDEIISEFGNKPLEEILYFQKNNSTAEMVARYIFEKLEGRLPQNVKLLAVTVTEEPFCRAKYTK